MGDYNAPAGRPGQRKEGGSREPTVYVPQACVQGVWVDAEAMIWNSAKQAFWVDFGDGFRDWFAETQVRWQHKLMFPES